MAPNHRSGMNGFMPRTARVARGRFVYHVLNRSIGRMHIFRKDVDFEAFERSWLRRASGNPSASCRTVFGTHGSSRRPATEGEPCRERYQRVAACGSGGGNFGGYTHIDIQSPWVKLSATRFRPSPLVRFWFCVQSRELSGLDEDWFIGFFRSSRLSRLYRVFAIGRRRARRLREDCKDRTHRQPAIFAIFMRWSKAIHERTQ